MLAMSRVKPTPGKPTPAPRGQGGAANGVKPPWGKPDSPGKKMSNLSPKKNLQQGGKKPSNDNMYMNKINEFMRTDRNIIFHHFSYPIKITENNHSIKQSRQIETKRC